MTPVFHAAIPFSSASVLGLVSDDLIPLAWASVCGIVMLTVCLVMLRRAQRVNASAQAALKAAQEEARTTERRWKLLFEQSPLSIQIFSPDGQTIRFNNAWRELFRLSDEMGYGFNVLKAPDLIESGAVNLIKLAFQGEAVKVPPVPFPVKTDPPQVRWIGGVLYPVKDKDDQVMEVVVIHHDITEMKRAEDAMLALNQTLEKRVAERTEELEAAQCELAKALETERDLGELKSRFVSMVSHEFRTPLGVTMSAVELLTGYDDRLSAEQKSELLQDIRSATTSMKELMEQVLLLGKVEAGKLGFRPALLSLPAVAERFIEEVKSSLNHKCTVVTQFQHGLDEARADEGLLRHIIINLVSNAVKYSPAGGEVVVSALRDGDYAIIRVSDQGIGIPKEELEHLYEAFHRCENVGEIPGTGLGLVIVKRCVEMHSGSIQVESELGKGTSFTVRLALFGDVNE